MKAPASARTLFSRTPALLVLVALGGCAAPPIMVVTTPPPACISTQLSATWISPDAPHDRELLDRTCTGLGQPSIVAGHRSPPIDRLTVVSWNVHAGAGDLAALLDALARDPRYEASGFVFLLQEATAATRRTARQHSLSFAYAPALAESESDGGERGTAIASTVPFDDVTMVELPFERQRRMAVGAMVAGKTTDGSPWQLAVISVHLDVGLMLSRGGNERARWRQALAVDRARSISRLELLPVVVGGDFNTSFGPDEPAANTMRQLFPDTRQPRAPTWFGPLGLSRQLDYLFAKTGVPVDVTILPERFGSDHHPVAATLPLAGTTLRVSSPASSGNPGEACCRRETAQ